MKFIKKIKLHNFKRFRDFKVECNETTNLFIGDNESGKSTILSAIDIVLSGSRKKVERIGLESLFNRDVINEFLKSKKTIEYLPTLFIEIYLNEQNNPDMNGKDHSDNNVSCDGLQLVCKPLDALTKEILDILKQEESNFPFEYYSISFITFSGLSYTGYKRFLKHLIIDSSQINNEHATREYIKAIYQANILESENNKHDNEYRKHKDLFRENILSDLNNRLESYYFTIQTNFKSNLSTDLTLAEDGITIDNRGKGQQCFIRTEFALKKKDSGRDLDVILLEEPENHLSHTNMKKLVRRISESHDKQIFVATHNSLISSRLDLRKSILLNSNNFSPVLLNDLPEETSKFFIKAPDNNILEYILSKKVILVEGDAEFILMELFYKNVIDERMEDSDIHVISVGGTSFKRYLDLANYP